MNYLLVYIIGLMIMGIGSYLLFKSEGRWEWAPETKEYRDSFNRIVIGVTFGLIGLWTLFFLLIFLQLNFNFTLDKLF